MSSPLFQSGWLFVPGGLLTGLAIGALMPSPKSSSPEAAFQAGLEGKASAESNALPGAAAEKEDDAETQLFPGANSEDSVAKLSPEKLMEVFDRVSNLKSDARKYAMVYRLVSQMDLDQLGSAMEAALVDWQEKKDYSTTRAVARRWADLDPQTIVAKGASLKNYHILQPALETWLKTSPEEPLKWALQQDATVQVDVIKQMLEIRSDFKGKQIEQLVMAAAESPNEAMRNNIFPMATARLAEENPRGALHAVQNLPQTPYRQQVTSNILVRIAKTQPDVAKTWLSSQPNLPAPERQVYEKIIKTYARPPAQTPRP